MVTFVISLNAKRRHLTSKERAIIAVESLPLYEAEAAARHRIAVKAAAEQKERDSSGKFHQTTQQVGESGNRNQKHEGETAGSGRPKTDSPAQAGESTPKVESPSHEDIEAKSPAACRQI